MTIETPYHQDVKTRLADQLAATHVGIEDYSHLHAGHIQNTGHHLKITVVSPQFDGMNPLQRHRVVHKVLKDDMTSQIHALELNLLAPDEADKA